MKLRILRKYKKELACSPLEVRYGGSNQMKLVSYDTLQYFDEVTSEWLNVPIVMEGIDSHIQSKG